MLKWSKLFNLNTCNVFGMIHVKALPGAPRNNSRVDFIVEEACLEAEIYTKCGVDGIIVENMHDVPYVTSRQLQPETTSVMTRVCLEVKKLLPSNMPCGVQILAGGNKEALAVALACDLQFIRCEGFVFSHVADEGLMEACSGELLRYRKQVGAEDILILTDVKKKHSAHAITCDVSLVETVKAAEFFLSDGVILTGKSTGDAVDLSELVAVKGCTQGPVLVGSGVTVQNVTKYLSADGLIIGSHFKEHGRWDNAVDKERVLRLMDCVTQLRQ